MVKAILINDNGVSSQAEQIVGTTKEAIVRYVENEAKKLCNEQGYTITKEDDYKFEVKFVDKRFNNLVTTTTVHFNFNVMYATLVN